MVVLPTLFAIVLGVQNAGGATPQPSASTAVNTKVQTLQRVESGVGDIDPLGVSLRQLSVDLRQPVGFGGVYHLSASQSPTGRGAFARVSGATVAVFDQSTYASTRDGPTPTVPPGTVFYIGGLPQRPEAPRAATNAISTAVDTRAPVVADTAAQAPRYQTPTVTPDRAPDPPAAAADRVASQWPQDPNTQAEPASPNWAPTAPTGIFGDEKYRGARVAQLLRHAASLTVPAQPTK